MYTDANMGHNQKLILLTLWRYGPHSAASLVESFREADVLKGVTHQSVRCSLAALKQREYVEVVSSRTYDGRRIWRTNVHGNSLARALLERRLIGG